MHTCEHLLKGGLLDTCEHLLADHNAVSPAHIKINYIAVEAILCQYEPLLFLPGLFLSLDLVQFDF